MTPAGPFDPDADFGPSPAGPTIRRADPQPPNAEGFSSPSMQHEDDSDDGLWLSDVADEPEEAWVPLVAPPGERVEELPDPRELFELMRLTAEGDESPDEGPDLDLPDPAVLFRQMQAGLGPPEEADDLPDPDALFRQMQGGFSSSADVEELPDAEALFLEMQSELVSAADSIDLPDAKALFFEMTARETLPPPAVLSDEDLPDPGALFLEMQSREQGAAFEREEDLPDPQALFLQMQALEAVREAEPPSQAPTPPLSAPLTSPAPSDDLPDPTALFLQMQSHLALEDSLGVDKPNLFSRIKAKFGGKDKKAASKKAFELDDLELPREKLDSPLAPRLPDPAELFRRMQDEEDTLPSASPAPLATLDDDLAARFPKTSHGSSERFEADSDLLPQLPDLDAFRAELEAEELERLDPDLLGDLSGPERFADTVSDLAFSAGSFFETAPEKGSLQKAPEHRQDKAREGPLPAPMTEEPLPAMLRPQGPQVPQAPRTLSPMPDSFFEDDLQGDAQGRGGWKPPAPAPVPLYRPSLATDVVAKPPNRRKSSSTAIMPKEGSSEGVAGPGLLQRARRYWSRPRSLTRQGLSVFTRQLAAMLKAGISVHQAIAFCAEADPEAAPILKDVTGKIETGYSLSSALKDYPESFDQVYVGLVHSGELSGRLNEMLGKLADILERELELRKRMIAVITYPAVLLVVSMLGTLGFIFFILPQLTPMFLDLKVELPWPTKILLNLREVLLPIAMTLVLSAIAALLSKGQIAAYLARNPVMERKLAYVPLALPVLGPVYDKLITARVLYSLATMLEVGVTMSQALARAEGTSGNAYVAYRLGRARADLADGSTVTECFAMNQVFPDTALQLISAGEESAKLTDMFVYIARHYDEEVTHSMDSAAGLLEPLIMMGMGLIVGFITIAAALPTLTLLQNFG